VRISTSGLRVTRQRVAVLDAISHGEHLDVAADYRFNPFDLTKI
jgi:Fe2+ or Zn2+ uptake regulation protein